MLIAMLMGACSGQKNKPEKKQKYCYAVETFTTDDGGWGYNVSINKKLVIKQNIIPAVSQRVSFKTEAEAQKTGELVVKKLQNNKMPSIKIQELDSMHIDYSTN